MNPLELEIYHQIKNVIPFFNEYLLFMVDTDTTVDPLSVNRLISVYVYFSWPVLFIYLFDYNSRQRDPRQEAARRLRRNRVG